MNDEKIINGVIHHPGDRRRSDFLFRVSLKAVIFNKDGYVLVVKEIGRNWWDLPGGGIDHGESVREALARELYEEVSLTGEFEYEAILTEDPRYLEAHNLYQMRITFLIKPKLLSFEPGEDGEEILFVNPLDFKDSMIIKERKIYEYSQLAAERLK